MLDRIKIRQGIDQALNIVVKNLITRIGLPETVPSLSNGIIGYLLRDGKRIRSTLFTLSYLSHGGTPCPEMFTSAASLELLHLFALIQDDIFDKSDLRRGELSLHKIFESALPDIPADASRNLAIIFSDILYGGALEAFLHINSDQERKETALKTILDAAVQTGNGQFLELLHSSRRCCDLSIEEIYHIYDLKTATYTFTGPLSAGAQLAGALPDTIDKMSDVGINLGRAYQISDDLNECRNADVSRGIPPDIAEYRNTILMWHLRHFGTPEAQKILIEMENTCTVEMTADLLRMFNTCGSFAFAFSEMQRFFSIALQALSSQSTASSSEIRSFLSELLDLTPYMESTITYD